MADEVKPFGRPPKYKPEYCEMLVEHMAKGKSFETFAFILNTHRDTLYEWENAYADFADAKKRGREASYHFFEELGQQGMTSKVFHDAIWIFQMKNRFKWTDKVEVTTGEDGEFKLAYDPRRKVPKPNSK